MKRQISLLTILTFFTLLILPTKAYAQDVDVGGTVDRENPTINITNPSSGATVYGVVNIRANASDDAGIEKVEFYIDGVLKFTDTASPYSFSWDSAGVGNGTHQISAKVYDVASKTASDSITVTVDNEVLQSPTKKIKEPKIGPHKASPSGERRTTLVQIPEEEAPKPFIAQQKEFLLGIAVGMEIFLVIFLAVLLRRRKY